MESHGVELLIASIAALGAGPLLYHLARNHRTILVTVHGAVVISILALVVLHILPECVEMAGWVALAAAGAGLVGPVAFERRMTAAFSQAPKLALGVAFIALLVHEFTDGLALVGGHEHAHAHEHSESSVHALGLAVVLHRIPTGAALFWMLRSHGARVVAGAFAAVTLVSCMGFAFGEHVLELLDPAALALFQAFVGGVLLHVLLHSHRERSHSHAVHREA
jgi:hypothetical protein